MQQDFEEKKYDAGDNFTYINDSPKKGYSYY